MPLFPRWMPGSQTLALSPQYLTSAGRGRTGGASGVDAKPWREALLAPSPSRVRGDLLVEPAISAWVRRGSRDGPRRRACDPHREPLTLCLGGHLVDAFHGEGDVATVRATLSGTPEETSKVLRRAAAISATRSRRNKASYPAHRLQEGLTAFSWGSGWMLRSRPRWSSTVTVTTVRCSRCGLGTRQQGGDGCWTPWERPLKHDPSGTVCVPVAERDGGRAEVDARRHQDRPTLGMPRGIVL